MTSTVKRLVVEVMLTGCLLRMLLLSLACC
jgi:hypothetical protein